VVLLLLAQVIACWMNGGIIFIARYWLCKSASFEKLLLNAGSSDFQIMYSQRDPHPGITDLQGILSSYFLDEK